MERNSADFRKASIVLAKSSIALRVRRAIPLAICTLRAACKSDQLFSSANACSLAIEVAPIPRLGSLITRSKLMESSSLAINVR